MKTQLSNPIGIIAGDGHLPHTVIEASLALGQDIFVVALSHNTQQSPLLAQIPHAIVNIAAVGKAIQAFKKNNVERIVFAGHVKRPKWSELRPDATGLKLLGRIKNNSDHGDNALLSSIIKFFEEQGFKVIGIDSIVKELLVPKGALGKHMPDGQALKDIAVGTKVLDALGYLDVGQSIVVEHEVVLGIEAAEGTDNLIIRCAELGQENIGGVLIKRKKQGQEHRIDLPTIGPITVEHAYRSGLKGIAVQANATLILDHAFVVKKIDDYKMFIIGVE
jgi:DUF1009 family protein